MGFLNIISKSKKSAQSASNNYRKTGLETNVSNYGWYTCAHCGRKLRKDSVEIDHIIPKSKGGTNQPENLQCLCIHCNRSKRDKTDRSKADLKNRKKTYGEYKRSEVLKTMTVDTRKRIRTLYSQLGDEDILEMLNSPKVRKDPAVFAEIKKEAKRRGIVV